MKPSIPPWLRSLRRPTTATVTVELDLDATGFVDAMDRIRTNTLEHDSRRRYQRRVEHERSLARAYVGVLLDGLCHSFGLDPVVVWRGPRDRDARLVDLNAPGRTARQAAEAAWLRSARAHQAAQVAARAEATDA